METTTTPPLDTTKLKTTSAISFTSLGRLLDGASHVIVPYLKNKAQNVKAAVSKSVIATPSSASPFSVSGRLQVSLALDPEAKRIVKLETPATITSAELKRIQQWIAFQLIVEDPAPNLP